MRAKGARSDGPTGVQHWHRAAMGSPQEHCYGQYSDSTDAGRRLGRGYSRGALTSSAEGQNFRMWHHVAAGRRKHLLVNLGFGGPPPRRQQILSPLKHAMVSRKSCHKSRMASRHHPLQIMPTSRVRCWLSRGTTNLKVRPGTRSQQTLKLHRPEGYPAQTQPSAGLQWASGCAVDAEATYSVWLGTFEELRVRAVAFRMTVLKVTWQQLAKLLGTIWSLFWGAPFHDA